MIAVTFSETEPNNGPTTHDVGHGYSHRSHAPTSYGHHYLWGVYPLTGDDSLLERFYQKSNNSREHWATLLDNVGRLLENTNKQHFNENLKNRTIAFFDWRLEAEEPVELTDTQIVKNTSSPCIYSARRVLSAHSTYRTNVRKGETP